MCCLFCDADVVGLSSTGLPPSPSSLFMNGQELKDRSSHSGSDPEKRWTRHSEVGQQRRMHSQDKEQRTTLHCQSLLESNREQKNSWCSGQTGNMMDLSKGRQQKRVQQQRQMRRHSMVRRQQQRKEKGELHGEKGANLPW